VVTRANIDVRTIVVLTKRLQPTDTNGSIGCASGSNAGRQVSSANHTDWDGANAFELTSA
jgi:hypothetical protein